MSPSHYPRAAAAMPKAHPAAPLFQKTPVFRSKTPQLHPGAAYKANPFSQFHEYLGRTMSTLGKKPQFLSQTMSTLVGGEDAAQEPSPEHGTREAVNSCFP